MADTSAILNKLRQRLDLYKQSTGRDWFVDNLSNRVAQEVARYLQHGTKLDDTCMVFKIVAVVEDDLDKLGIGN